MTISEAMTPPPGFVESLREIGMHPGWAKREPAMWPTPRPTFVPAVWRYANALGALTEACSFVSPALAERRNLILANPIPGNSYATCSTLVVAYQLVLPGETARSHRHTPNALRVVLDAEDGMYTLVNGVRVDMAPNDVVLTPQWHWHGHANLSHAPAFWIDILDVPFVQKLENIFFEHHPETLEQVQSADPESSLRAHGNALLAAARDKGTHRIGADSMPTIGLTMEAIAANNVCAHPPLIENTILVVLDGALELSVAPLGTTTLTRGDVAIVPAWHEFRLAAGAGGTVWLRVTDAPIFETLRFRDVSQSNG